MANRKAIGEILQVAQGELALEQYIKDVKEYWTRVQFKIVVREGNIRLITEWSELFTMLEDRSLELSGIIQLFLSCFLNLGMEMPLNLPLRRS
jgi:dynein heavy chain 1, cytosolic